MAQLSRASMFQRVFSDPKNYPYGFSRSGDFSISESKALSQYGCLITALLDGRIEPECEEDISFLAVAKGEKDPSTTAEKAWSKYDKRIHRPKLGNIYGSRPSSQSNDDDMSEDSDLEIELDD
ncbi:DUF413 domain-containing protein [Paraglaciecola chathamensis]|jgi:uncharacterized protein YifE (UPF0438 family)|uniref:Macrodomain Ori protein n=4 Tax=Paraglaciecola chathamensis TaxID=368405 RepID=A0ABS0WJQ0_9ALTE|nr:MULTISPECIES: DUF413 domain-containing protein [Paraglaciecola]AEE21657.1 protein of unknown function DUF413 [Glaciecola sp. 4H-3-7+YE-5]MBN24284.1 DUF413 family protein [Alteromonadaceae bacterium]MBJ2138706.1 DUF413 domain-containing protein [Paraglaciecola chathamensis]MBU3019006.1 DUF413 domain-containing protein [Paraglaciecola agarilytica]MDO6558001.1 DUF413 domain-containing protein [Paraglaciecola chathamensis]|tara:strand:- start:173 stop:541 length:369 start_codon:yes stop_codon:yes gene_type:complete